MNSKLTYAFIFFTSIVAMYGNAQTILNGDFEIHSLDTCAFNLENVEFNAVMENVFAVGTENAMDVQTDSCGFFPTISNNWYVSLSQRPTGPVDQISLEIDQPLEEGTMYQLSYYELADTSSNPVNFNSNMPLEIGLSTSVSSFGQVIYSSIPEPDVWTLRTFEFSAPNNGRFITVRMAGESGLKGWNFVDNLQLGPWTDVFETGKMKASIYPNPARDWVTIETDFSVKSIRIFNAVGQEVYSFSAMNPYYNKLELNSLTSGIYFLDMVTEKKRVVKRIEII